MHEQELLLEDTKPTVFLEVKEEPKKKNWRTGKNKKKGNII